MFFFFRHLRSNQPRVKHWELFEAFWTEPKRFLEMWRTREKRSWWRVMF